MASDALHFAKLLRVELEDLIEDIKLLIDNTEKRFGRDEITAFVRLENEALLRRELDAFYNIVGVVDGIDPSIYKCIDDIEADFLIRLRESVSRHEDPEVVFVLLKRKLEKVRLFISSDDTESASRYTV